MRAGQAQAGTLDRWRALAQAAAAATPPSADDVRACAIALRDAQAMDGAELEAAWSTTLELAVRCGDLALRGIVGLTAANELAAARRFDAVDRVVERELDFFATRDLSLQAQFYQVRATVELESGRYPEGLQSLAQARRTLERLPIPSQASAWPNQLGREIEAHLALGLPDVAAELAELEWQALATLRARVEALPTDQRGLYADALLESEWLARWRLASIAFAQARFSRVRERVRSALEDPQLPQKLRPHFRMLGLSSMAQEALRVPEQRTSTRAALLDALGDPELADTQRLEVLLLAIEHSLLAGESSTTATLLADAARFAGRSQLAGLDEHLIRYRALRHRYLAEHTDAENERAAALQDLESSWERFLGVWRRVPVRAGGYGFLQYGSRLMVLAEVVQAALKNPEATDAQRLELGLQRIVEAQALGSFARRAGYADHPISTVLETLCPSAKHGLLVYLPANTSGHVFAVSAGKIIHEKLPATGELRALNRRWMRDLRRPPSGPDKDVRQRFVEHPAAAELADALLPNTVRKFMEDWDTVTVVGADLIGYLPMEYLPVDGRFFGELAAVDYLPSLPVGVVLAERARERERRTHSDESPELILIAAPALDSEARAEFEAIELTPARRERLLTGFDGANVTQLVGPAATPEALADPALGRARLLHVLAHGTQLSGRERDTALILAAPKGQPSVHVDCSFIEAEVSAPPVVILSACGAGQNKTRRGDDSPTHFGVAFLAAGADVCVLSPNDLQLEAQTIFVAALQRELRAGTTVAKAAQRARAELARNPRWSHPYFGLVHVVGLGSTRPFASGTR